MQTNIDGKTLVLVEGDITVQQVDAIVNAANESLAGGGGVDGAIHQRGGPTIIAETDQNYPNGCPTGSAVISAAGNLDAKYVIHAVGPIWRGGGGQEAAQLASAYRTCLELAAANECRSVAFPSLSTGAYHYPLEEAAKIALSTAIEFLRTNDQPGSVRYVLFGRPAYEVFAETLRGLTSNR